MSHPPVPAMSPLTDQGSSAYARYIPLPFPEDAVRGMFFTSLMNLVRTQAGDSALRQCQQMLGDKKFQRSFMSFANYPATDFLRVAHAASVMLTPHLGGPEQAARLLGMATVRDFTNSMAGKTLLSLAGSSPMRFLSSLPTGYRAAVNFGERTVTPRGDKGAIVTFRRDFFPLVHSEGVLLAVLESTSAKNARVRSRPLGPLDSEYDVTWE
jgi:uncharacterized protein (TIGR02265 family)